MADLLSGKYSKLFSIKQGKPENNRNHLQYRENRWDSQATPISSDPLGD